MLFYSVFIFVNLLSISICIQSYIFLYQYFSAFLLNPSFYLHYEKHYELFKDFSIFENKYAFFNGVLKLVPSTADRRLSLSKEKLYHEQIYVIRLYGCLIYCFRNFLICWFVFNMALNLLYTKFLGSIGNIKVKSRLYTRINFFIQLNCLFHLYFFALCIIQIGDIELNPCPKSSILSGLPICYWNPNSLAAHKFLKVLKFLKVFLKLITQFIVFILFVY